MQRVVIEDVTESLVDGAVKMNATIRRLLALDTCIVPLQTDLLDALTLARLEYYANVIVRVQPVPGEEVNSSRCARVELRQRRPGGRVSVQRQQYDIDSRGMAVNFVTLPEHQASAPLSRPSEPAKSVQPKSTFNLGMTIDQKSVKDALVLPYMRMTLEDGEVKAEERKPVLAPDFDDEDPDDDLDI